MDTHWSTRSMARSQGMSQSAVSRTWRAFGLKPRIVQTWKLSTDPQFTDKVRDVVGFYMSPPENALVLWVDEKSQIQALDRTAPCLPMPPTTPARMTHDYVRNSTTSLFAAFDLTSGSVIAQPHRQHRLPRPYHPHRRSLRVIKLARIALTRGPHNSTPVVRENYHGGLNVRLRRFALGPVRSYLAKLQAEPRDEA